MLKSQEGSTVILFASLVVGVGSILMFSSVTKTSYLHSQLSRLKVRQALRVQQLIIEKVAAQPSSYISCNSKTGYSSCNIDPQFRNSFRFKELPGAKCDVEGTECGLALEGLNIQDDGVLTGEIIYKGSDFSFKPIKIEINIPVEVLQSQTAICSEGVFNGFNSNGTISCAPLPRCGEFSFVHSVDISSMSLECNEFPTDVIDVGEQEMLNMNGWEYSGNLLYSSSPRNQPTWWE